MSVPRPPRRSHSKALEALDLREGDEVTIAIVSSPSKSRADWLERTFGAWAGLVDAEGLVHDLKFLHDFWR
jgi:hypothetical protein